MGRMSLAEWLMESHGVDFDPTGADSLQPSLMAQRLYDALVEAGKDYSEQKAILRQSCLHHCHYAFANACIDIIGEIDSMLQRLEGVPLEPVVEKRYSGVRRNKSWPAGKVYAEYRFSAARPLQAEVIDSVDDMVCRMARDGYLEPRPELITDLRQGLGYYLPTEDPLRRRRTVKWLRGQNLLHCYVSYLLGGADPLVRLAPGSPGCWIVAASLFIDRNGCAFTNQRLEHGTVSDANQLQTLRAFIPRTPMASHALRPKASTGIFIT